LIEAGGDAEKNWNYLTAEDAETQRNAEKNSNYLTAEVRGDAEDYGGQQMLFSFSSLFSFSFVFFPSLFLFFLSFFLFFLVVLSSGLPDFLRVSADLCGKSPFSSCLR
jgi:hypothetical protein